MSWANRSLHSLLYADDVVLLARSPANMRRLLFGLWKFCQAWGMTINPSKSRVVAFNDRSDQYAGSNWSCIPDGTYSGMMHTSEYRYLGLVFHRTKGIRAAPQHLAKAGQAALCAAQSTCMAEHIDDPFLRQLMFNQLIRPIISYGSELWGCMTSDWVLDDSYFTGNPCEAVSCAFLRWHLGAPSTAHRRLLPRAARSLPLFVDWVQRMAVFWNKLTTTGCDRLLRIAFLEQIQLEQQGWYTVAGGPPWVRSALRVFRRLGFLTDDTATAAFTQISEGGVVAALTAQIDQYWRDAASVQRPPTVHAFAQLFSQPEHADIRLKTGRLVGDLWRAAQRFCTGDHQLAGGLLNCQMHRGHQSDRICRLCRQGAEDEPHFFLHCPAYAAIRADFPTLFPAAAPSTPDRMRSAYSIETLNEVGKFLNRAFKHRSQLLITQPAPSPQPNPASPPALPTQDA